MQVVLKFDTDVGVDGNDQYMGFFLGKGHGRPPGWFLGNGGGRDMLLEDFPIVLFFRCRATDMRLSGCHSLHSFLFWRFPMHDRAPGKYAFCHGLYLSCS